MPWGETGSASMKRSTFESMSIDEMWSLHEQITSILARKIEEEKAKLEERLRSIESVAISPSQSRRPYPKVLPKYRNPNDPHETWAGRGKRPRWVRTQLRLGKKLDDFLIKQSSA